MNNSNLFIGFLLISMISGCSSEVDKCVDAQVKAWEVRKSRLLEANTDGKINWESYEDQSLNQSKEEVASDARLRCLRVTNKSN